MAKHNLTLLVFVLPTKKIVKEQNFLIWTNFPSSFLAHNFYGLVKDERGKACWEPWKQGRQGLLGAMGASGAHSAPGTPGSVFSWGPASCTGLDIFNHTLWALSKASS